MNIKNLTVGQLTSLIIVLLMTISTIAFFMQPYDWNYLTDLEQRWLIFNIIGCGIIIIVSLIKLGFYLDNNWNKRIF